MKTSDLTFELPNGAIALRPLKDRSSSRLMVVQSGSEFSISHARFSDLLGILREGDLLVLNNSKVIPARLRVRKTTGGVIDLILVRPDAQGRWEILCKGSYTGDVLIGNETIGYISICKDTHTKTMTFYGDIKKVIEQYGLMPLPPYIKRPPDEADRLDYQTVYAAKEGSIAAPTAGLHFTQKLLDQLRQKGIDIEYLTLHVGIGTFMPVSSEDITAHRMEEERFEVSCSLIDKIRQYRSVGKRVIAVGTTTTRTLEGIFSDRYCQFPSLNGTLYGSTDIFIYPGYRFKAIDGLITNFHLPKSTPLMLVSALLGIEKTREIYGIAIQEGYRFFSYGDAMLIL